MFQLFPRLNEHLKKKQKMKDTEYLSAYYLSFIY